MALRSRQRLIVIAVLTVCAAPTGLLGCDDDATPDGGLAEGDAGGPRDGGPPDAGPRDATVYVTVQGTVFVEDALDRTLDGGVTPWPDDGGAPDAAAAVTPGGRVAGAPLRLRTLDGQTIATATTDALGAWSLRAPADRLTFLQVEPVPGLAGQIRAEQTRGTDYAAFDVVLSEETGLDEAMSSVGITRDLTRGVIACGFNPVDDQAGGDGAELGPGVDHDPAFNLTDVGSILGNRLVPLCQSDGSTPPGALPGATCTTAERARQVFFPNVATAPTRVEPLDPASGSCALRFAIDAWLVEADHVTVVNVDCAP